MSIFDDIRNYASSLKTKAQTGIQNWAQTNPQQATRIINAPQQIKQTYQKVSPYVPFTPQVNPQAINRGIQNWQQAGQTFYNQAYKPVVNFARQEIAKPSPNLLQFTKKGTAPIANAMLSTYGLAKAPVQAAVGGLVGIGFNRLSKNKISPGKAFGSGAQFVSLLEGMSPVTKATNPLISNFIKKQGAIGNVGRGVAQEFLKGAGYGAVTGQNPLKTGIEFAPYGVMGAGNQGKFEGKMNLKEAKILRSDLEELSKAYKTISEPLQKGKQIDMNKYQGALDFMSDLKNQHKINIPEKAWRGMSPQQQHNAIFTALKDKIMGGQNVSNLVENKPEVTGVVVASEQRAKVENFIKELPEVKKKVNLIDYIRTPSKVLEKIGLKNESVVLDKAHFNYEQQLKSEVQKIAKWYEQAPNPQSAVNIFKHLDGQNVTLAPNEMKVANEIKPYLAEWANKLGLPKDQRIASYITHIFEKGIVQKEFDPEIAKIIANKVPGSVYDPFLEKRLGTMGYKENVWEALEAYVKRATRKVNMDPALEKLSKAAETLDLESYNYVKKLGDRINLRPTEIDNLVDNLIKSSPIGYKLGQRPTNLITSKFRQMIYRATLGLNVSSSMKNLTQGANTFAELGGKYTAKGYFDLAKKGTKELVDNGILNDAIIQDKDIHIMKKFMSKVDDGLFALFDFAEKVNRGSAYYGAKAKGLSQGMNEQQAIDFARNIVAKTQFKFSNIDTPLTLSSDIAKTLAQFQSFSLKQTEFLAGKIKAKEWGGLLRYTLASLAMINTVGKLFGMRVQDLIPSLRFESPLTNLTSTTGELLSTDEDTRAKGKRDLLKQSKLLVPAGVQAEKTYTGLKTVGQGYSQNATGKYEYPVKGGTEQTIRAGLFGKYNLPEAREYYKEGRTPLSENQSARAKAFGTEQYYKELGGRYKDEAIAAYLKGDYKTAAELQKKYDIKVTNKELTNVKKKEVVEAYFSGDYKTASELQKKYNIQIKPSDEVMKTAAKKKAIELYLQKNYVEASSLQKKYGLKITRKDIYGQ